MTTLPTFVVEEHRYTRPTDGWVFVTLSPNTQGDWMGDEQPFLSDEVERPYATYDRKLEGWMLTPDAEVIRERLVRDGFTKVSWDTVPPEVVGYVWACIVPIEWQDDPEFCKEMSVIWLKGEWPSFE